MTIYLSLARAMRDTMFMVQASVAYPVLFIVERRMNMGKGSIARVESLNRNIGKI
jgi:hypothetical protein